MTMTDPMREPWMTSHDMRQLRIMLDRYERAQSSGGSDKRGNPRKHRIEPVRRKGARD